MKTITRLLIAGGVVVTLFAGVAVSYAGRATTSTVDTGTISATTAGALLHMVEEEKLAHNVYVTLAGTTGLTIFDRISASETRHESELQTLILRHELTDPTAGNAVGEFTDPEFTALYERLVAAGDSAAAALDVGTTIEQLDIADLRERLTADLPGDVTATFDRLIAGSERHLTAFDRHA